MIKMKRKYISAHDLLNIELHFKSSIEIMIQMILYLKRLVIHILKYNFSYMQINSFEIYPICTFWCSLLSTNPDSEA